MYLLLRTSELQIYVICLKNEFRLNDFKICSLQPFFCCPGLLTLFTLYIKWQRIHCLWVIKPLVYLGYSPSRPPCGTQSFTFCAILSSGKCVGNVVDSTIFSSPNEDRLTLPERIQLFKLWYLPRIGSPKCKLVLVFFHVYKLNQFFGTFSRSNVSFISLRSVFWRLLRIESIKCKLVLTFSDFYAYDQFFWYLLPIRSLRCKLVLVFFHVYKPTTRFLLSSPNRESQV